MFTSIQAFGTAYVRPTAWQDIKHIVVVVLENTKFKDAIAQPFLGGLAQKGALLSNYKGVVHPSQPNYIALISGNTHGVLTDMEANLDKAHLGDLLENQNLSWKAYAEGYPGNGFLGTKSGRFVRKHVPFLSFKNVQSSPQRMSKIVDAWEIYQDQKNNTVPSFSLVIPDQDNNGHDTNVARASYSMNTFLSPMINDPEIMKDTLLIITFDEDDGSDNNRVYTVFIGAGVKINSQSSKDYNHYSLLRTIEEIFRLGNLGEKDKDAKIILDIWKD
jgi:phospholipase C